MYYELYVDVLFLVNFVMDFILLLLVKKMLKCTATHGRLCLGAALGSVLTCIVVILPIPYAIFKFILFHMFVNIFMIRVGLKIKHIRSFAKAYFLLYIGSFLLGGILQAFWQYVREGSLFFATVIVGYLFVSKIWDYIGMIKRIERYQCEVDLYVNGERYHVKGMIDTGNGLRDPVSNKPVSILERDIAKKILGNEKLSQVRYIPYHSIGKKEGVLLALKIEKMCVHGEDEHWIEEPLIGVSEEKISVEGEYQMILNPNLF